MNLDKRLLRRILGVLWMPEEPVTVRVHTVLVLMIQLNKGSSSVTAETLNMLFVDLCLHGFFRWW